MMVLLQVEHERKVGFSMTNFGHTSNTRFSLKRKTYLPWEFWKNEKGFSPNIKISIRVVKQKK